MLKEGLLGDVSFENVASFNPSSTIKPYILNYPMRLDLTLAAERAVITFRSLILYAEVDPAP